MDGDGARGAQAVADPWALPRWLELCALSLRGLLNAGGVLGSAVCCMFALQPLFGAQYLFIGALISFTVFLVSERVVPHTSITSKPS